MKSWGLVVAISISISISISVSLSPRANAGVSVKTIGEAELPKGVKVAKGFQLQKAIAWTDKNGGNVLMFSSRESTRTIADVEARSVYLNVEHVAVAGAKVKQLRLVRDKVEDCDFDLTAEFLDAATGVTDLDNDGVSEVTFAYQLACRSDVSPLTVKLLLLENGQKYILRGQSVVPVDNEGKETWGGEYDLDPRPAKWHKAFREHAETLWREIVLAP
jgi:hypothetical protein